VRAALALLLLAGCTSLEGPPGARTPAAVPSDLEAPRLDPSRVAVSPEPATVEDAWILDVYGWLKGDDYESYRVEFPGVDGTPGVAHLLLPPGRGRHPGVLVLPIRGGSHLVSEALAQALVHRGYAALRLERRRLFPPEGCDGSFEEPARRLRRQVLDARRLVDWLEQHPRVDPERLGVAGVSLGGMMAVTLMGADARLRAGVFIMAGGGIAEILQDSADPRMACLRERTYAEVGEGDAEAFLARVRGLVGDVDPLVWAPRIDPSRVLLVSARFDHVVRPEHSRRLWERLGRPAWVRVPSGHLEFLPFFWWSVGRGADHLDRVLALRSNT
jgi:dienelactone hydrolase